MKTAVSIIPKVVGKDFLFTARATSDKKKAIQVNLYSKASLNYGRGDMPLLGFTFYIYLKSKKIGETSVFTLDRRVRAALETLAQQPAPILQESTDDDFGDVSDFSDPEGYRTYIINDWVDRLLGAGLDKEGTVALFKYYLSMPLTLKDIYGYQDAEFLKDLQGDILQKLKSLPDHRFKESTDDDLGDVSEFADPAERNIRLVVSTVIEKLKELVPLAIFYPETISIVRTDKHRFTQYSAAIDVDNWLNKVKKVRITFSIREGDHFITRFTYQYIDAPIFIVEAESGGNVGYFEGAIHPTHPKEDYINPSGSFITAVKDANAKAKAAKTGAIYNDMKTFYKALANAGFIKGAVKKQDKVQYVAVKKDIHDDVRAFIQKMGWDKLGVKVTGSGIDTYLQIPYVVEKGNTDE